MKKLLILCTLLGFPLFANIDAQIEAIQKASNAERFILMNSFKKEIVQMQEEERIHAITKLQSITQSKHADKAMREIRTHIKQRQTTEQRRVKIKHREDREDETENSIENEDSLEDEIENETEDSVEDEVENETEDHIENEIEDHEEDEHDDD